MEIPSRFFCSTGKVMESGDTCLGLARKWTGKSPDKKAIESVSDWAKYRHGNGGTLPDGWEPNIIDNTPISGFEIVSFVSRSRTDNKWFEIVDPRGFKLQISCENLLSIIRDETIVNGIIQSECVWGFEQHPHLMGVQGSLYKDAMKEKSKTETRKKVSSAKLVPGQVYQRGPVNYSQYSIYVGRVNFKSCINERSTYWGSTGGGTIEVEENGYFLFLDFYFASYLDHKAYIGKNNLDLNYTKTCPAVFETNQTTVHDIQTIKRHIETSDRLKVPANIRKLTGKKTYGANKFIYIKVPEIGLDKTY